MTLDTVDGWYETRRLDDDVTLIWEPAIIPFVRCNMWHVRGRERDLLLDSGMGIVSLRRAIPLVNERPLLAVASHAHFDHVGCHHEFEERAIHHAEADILARPTRANTLAETYVTEDIFTGPLPDGFSCEAYSVRAAPATLLLEEGDAIDLGDRRFEVLHLPGHSPGSIALWEAASGILFSGDVVYDGPLVDDCYHSNTTDYLASMERLRALPARVVHGGHFPSFGRERMVALIEEYVAGRRSPGCPAERPANENEPSVNP